MTERKRNQKNASDMNSWNDVYGCYYKLLPENGIVNLPNILEAINIKQKATNQFSKIVSAIKKLVEINRRQDIREELANVLNEILEREKGVYLKASKF